MPYINNRKKLFSLSALGKRPLIVQHLPAQMSFIELLATLSCHTSLVASAVATQRNFFDTTRTPAPLHFPDAPDFNPLKLVSCLS